MLTGPWAPDEAAAEAEQEAEGAVQRADPAVEDHVGDADRQHGHDARCAVASSCAIPVHSLAEQNAILFCGITSCILSSTPKIGDRLL